MCDGVLGDVGAKVAAAEMNVEKMTLVVLVVGGEV